MNIVFTAALFAGAAAIALWIAVRFSRFAPASLTVRLVGTLVLGELVALLRVDPASWFTLYGSAFGVCLPVLTLAWLTGIWLLQSLRDAVPS